jgi:hypothetical protein
MVEVLSGTFIDNVRTITWSDNVDRVYFHKTFSGAPGNATFRFVRPATTIQANLRFASVGNGNVVFQRAHFNSGGSFFPQAGEDGTSGGTGRVDTAALTSTGAWWIGTEGASLHLLDAVRDPADPDNALTDYIACISDWGTASILYIATGNGFLDIKYVTTGGIWISGTQIQLKSCCALEGLQLYNLGDDGWDNYVFSPSGYAWSVFGGRSGNHTAIDVVHGGPVIMRDLKLIDCTHGMKIRDNAVARIHSGFTVSNISDYGALIRDGGVLKIAANPAITGTKGDITFDGKTKGGTWSDVWTNKVIAVSADHMGKVLPWDTDDDYLWNL